MLCHQTVSGVRGERLACGQGSREQRVIYGAEKKPATHRAAGVQGSAKQAHLGMRKLPPARPATQHDEGFWRFWSFSRFTSPLEGERDFSLFRVSWHFLVPNGFQQYSVPKAGSRHTAAQIKSVWMCNPQKFTPNEPPQSSAPPKGMKVPAGIFQDSHP